MRLSIVIPVLNEAESIPLILARIRGELRGFAWEIIFVDDGSSDVTVVVIEEAASADDRIKLLRFSRNFGHQAAVTAGLDFAEGDAVIVMDADMQDPPELIPRMIEVFLQGYDIVSPQRVCRESDSRFKRWTAAIYYQALSGMADQPVTPNVGDFRLFSRRAVVALRSLREQHRYMRGLVGWLGLKETTIPFERKPRLTGETKYPLFKMLRFAWTGVSSFSAFPLRLSIAGGCILSGAGFVYLLRVIYLALWTTKLVPGWASVVALQCAFSGIILLALGAVGDYVARTYEESKNRPLYVVTEASNLKQPHTLPQRAVILVEPTGWRVGGMEDIGRIEPAARDEDQFSKVTRIRA